MKMKNRIADPDEEALVAVRPHVLMEDAVYGAVVSRTVTKPLAGALDESLLGRVLPRRPNGIS